MTDCPYQEQRGVAVLSLQVEISAFWLVEILQKAQCRVVTDGPQWEQKGAMVLSLTQ